jgi:hypothetical protein
VVGVVEQALHAMIETHRYLTAVELSRAAANKLTRSPNWGPLARVLGLGLRAATAAGAGAVRDEAYFRYALAAHKAADGDREQAIELLLAIVSWYRDSADDDLAALAGMVQVRIRDASGQQQPKAATAVEEAADKTAEQAIRAAMPIVRQTARQLWAGAGALATRVPGVLAATQFAQNNPQVVRSGIAAVVVTVAILLGTSASTPPTNAAAGATQATSPSGNSPVGGNHADGPGAGPVTGANASPSTPPVTVSPASRPSAPSATTAAGGTNAETAGAGPTSLQPTTTTAQNHAYASPPDLTGNWTLHFVRDNFGGSMQNVDDVYDVYLPRLDQSRCPTADPCYGGNGTNPWNHDGHDETNNIVITPSLSGDKVVFTGTEPSSYGGVQYYNGTASNDRTQPLTFTGTWRHQPTNGPLELAHFTFVPKN